MTQSRQPPPTDMRWDEHILESDKSLVRALNMRLGALKKFSCVASFKTRKSIANGIFMSKLIYLMPLWSGCEEYLVPTSGPEQSCQNCCQDEHLHPNQETDEGMWVDVCEATAGLPQPGALAEYHGKPEASLSLPEDYIWG